MQRPLDVFQGVVRLASITGCLSIKNWVNETADSISSSFVSTFSCACLIDIVVSCGMYVTVQCHETSMICNDADQSLRKLCINRDSAVL